MSGCWNNPSIICNKNNNHCSHYTHCQRINELEECLTLAIDLGSYQTFPANETINKWISCLKGENNEISKE